MSFRDDRDALISRAEALERRTEQLQQELEAAASARDAEAEQNVALQRKLKKLQRERDKLADKLGLRSTGPHSPDPKRRKIVLVLAALLLVVGSGIPLFFMADEETPRELPRAVPAPVRLLDAGPPDRAP
jgi:LPS O-antigen subunit length determinant protein (WzzB/FepE family)